MYCVINSIYTLLLIHVYMCCCCVFFFFKQNTAYEMRISDWSSDVCSSDLIVPRQHVGGVRGRGERRGLLVGGGFRKGVDRVRRGHCPAWHRSVAADRKSVV